MKVAELLRSRRENWRHLDELCSQMENRRRSLGAPGLTRFAALYRAACADLALAEAYQLPPNTTSYLHRLVGRAHNQLYRSRSFNLASWGDELLFRVPQRLVQDRCLWLAFALFWGVFLLSMLMAAETKMPLTGRPLVPGFAERILGDEAIHDMENTFKGKVFGSDGGLGPAKAAVYIMHNTGIGLKCFAQGLVFGVGGLFATVFNAAYLGAAFGYMTRADQGRDNFFQFVTAHGPFELTAIVLSAAAGMRLGFSLINTGGLTRLDSLHKACGEAVPTMGAAAVLFAMAAMIEGFVSPSGLPYGIKAAVGAISAALLVTYFVLLGWPREQEPTDDAADMGGELETSRAGP